MKLIGICAGKSDEVCVLISNVDDNVLFIMKDDKGRELHVKIDKQEFIKFYDGIGELVDVLKALENVRGGKK